MDLLKKRGRPKSTSPKTRIFQIRLDESDTAKLEYVREKFGESPTEILREGLRMRYNLALFKD